MTSERNNILNGFYINTICPLTKLNYIETGVHSSFLKENKK
jgi:hypothetical protein